MKNSYDELDLNHLLPLYIGTIAKQWNEVEYQLAGLLARIGEIPPGVADVIVSTVGGNKVQRDLINNLAAYKRFPQPEQQKINALMRRCSKGAKKRNTVVHALFLLRDEHQFLALKDMSVMDLEPEAADGFAIDKAWLEAALDQIMVLACDIHAFTVFLGGTHCLKPPP